MDDLTRTKRRKRHGGRNPGPPTATLCIRVLEAAHAELKRMAEADHRSVSAAARRIIEDWAVNQARRDIAI